MKLGKLRSRSIVASGTSDATGHSARSIAAMAWAVTAAPSRRASPEEVASPSW
jgi:hypothetical protein